VSLSELRDQTFLVNPRSLTPAAFEGLKLMCREFGGFDPTVLESAVASTVALDTDWRPIQDGTAVAVMAEATARAVRPAHVAVVPIQPPPQYVLALAWRRGERAAAAHRLLSCLRSYRDLHAWTTDPEPARDQNQPAGLSPRTSAARQPPGEASQHDFHVFFVSDATATMDMGGVPADDLHWATCASLAQVFAQVATVDEILGTIAGAAPAAGQAAAAASTR
jgi:hypothetical protein